MHLQIVMLPFPVVEFLWREAGSERVERLGEVASCQADVLPFLTRTA